MILISILGDFHSSIFPLYYEFRKKIKRHIVVYDDAFNESKKHKKILNSLKKFNKKNKLNIITEDFKLDEDSFTSIIKLIAYIKKVSNNLNDVYVNSTDGLANICVILSSKLLNDGIKVIAYDMYENSYNITTKDSMNSYNITSKISIKDHFLLKGLEIESMKSKKFAHKHQKKIKKLFENYYDEFEIMKADMFKRNTKNKHKYLKASQIVNSLDLHMVKNYKDITGGLFEFYIYLLIKDLGFDDIEIGVKVNQYFNNSSKISNEFDILLMKDNHLHMIECKFTKNIKMQDLVYKYASLINLIDDDGKMIILTNHSNYTNDLYKNGTNTLQHYKRALMNKILIRGNIINNKKEFVEEVKTYFDLL